RTFPTTVRSCAQRHSHASCPVGPGRACKFAERGSASDIYCHGFSEPTRGATTGGSVLSPFAAVSSRGSTALLAPTILALLLGGCGTLSAFRADSVPLAGSSASPNGVGGARELAAEEVATTAGGSRRLTGGPEGGAAEG